jgi:hypothetical protein
MPRPPPDNKPREVTLDDLFGGPARRAAKEEAAPKRAEDSPFARGGRVRMDGVPGGVPSAGAESAMEGILSRERRASSGEAPGSSMDDVLSRGPRPPAVGPSATASDRDPFSRKADDTGRGPPPKKSSMDKI